MMLHRECSATYLRTTALTHSLHVSAPYLVASALLVV